MTQPRRALACFFLLLFAAANAAAFFPDEYKSFGFKEGDVLAYPGNGKFGVQRILKVDRVLVKRGEAISIRGRKFVAPEDDFLLVVSTSFGAPDYDTLEQARAAVANKSWKPSTGQMAMSPPGFAKGLVLLRNDPVGEAELRAYRQWKQAFDHGQAGIF
jgi:hypothetical protein